MYYKSSMLIWIFYIVSEKKWHIMKSKLDYMKLSFYTICLDV